MMEWNQIIIKKGKDNWRRNKLILEEGQGAWEVDTMDYLTETWKENAFELYLLSLEVETEKGFRGSNACM